MDLALLRGIAEREFFKHKLSEWRFVLNPNLGRRLGCCKHREQVIEIATYFAEKNPQATVIDTLLHEIAHALAGPGHGHDNYWKGIAISLGAEPTACATDGSIETKPSDWAGDCRSCGKVHYKYKTPSRLGGWRCPCPGKGSVVFRFVGKGPTPTIKENKGYVAICDGCKTVHRRNKQSRKPLICKCRRGSVLVWRKAE